MDTNVERIDTPQGRYYRITDTTSGTVHLFPSVTHILSSVIAKQHLSEWMLRTCANHIRANLSVGQVVTSDLLDTTLAAAVEQHRVIASEGMATGSAVHALLERRILDGRIPPLDGETPVVRRCFGALNTWWERQHIRPLQVERIVYSVAGRHAGTADLVGEVGQGRNLRRVLVDWKTAGSNFIPAEYGLQASSYAKSCHEMDDVRVDDIYVVVAQKATGNLRVRHIDADEQARLYRVFMCVREVFEWQSGNRTPSQCQPGRGSVRQAWR